MPQRLAPADLFTPFLGNLAPTHTFQDNFTPHYCLGLCPSFQPQVHRSLVWRPTPQAPANPPSTCLHRARHRAQDRGTACRCGAGRHMPQAKLRASDPGGLGPGRAARKGAERESQDSAGHRRKGRGGSGWWHQPGQVSCEVVPITNKKSVRAIQERSYTITCNIIFKTQSNPLRKLSSSASTRG